MTREQCEDTSAQPAMCTFHEMVYGEYNPHCDHCKEANE